MSIDEAALISKLQNPLVKREAFKQFMQHYQENLYRVIRRILIDHEDTNDALQETFLKVWEKVDGFNAHSSLLTWVYRIAVNEALQHIRRRQKELQNQGGYQNHLAGSLLANDALGGDEIQIKLQQAILQLPEKQRLVFNLKYYDDLSYQEIAQITGNKVGGLKASFHHAVKKIETFLKVD